MDSKFCRGFRGDALLWERYGKSMKYRKLTAILGTFLMIAAMTGCQKAGTDIQLETLEISSVEEVDESEHETEQKDGQMETMELDFSQIDEDAGDSLEVSTGDLAEPEELEELTEAETEASGFANTRKPGEAESQTELTEEVTESVKKETVTKKNYKKEPAKPHTEEEEQAGTEQISAESELVSVQSDRVQQMNETVPEMAGAQQDTDGASDTAAESESEEDTEAAGDAAAESESERAADGASDAAAESESERAADGASDAAAESESERTADGVSDAAAEEMSEAVGEGSAEKVPSPESESESAAEAIWGIRTVCDRVNIRREPSTEAEILALFTPGMKLLVIDTEGEWAIVRFESETGLTDGYIKTEFLYDAEQVCCAKEMVNVRAEATTESDKVGELPANEQVVLLKEENGWSRICYATDTGLMEAYVKSEFLEKSELSAGTSALMEAYEALRVEKTETRRTEDDAEAAAEGSEGGIEAGMSEGSAETAAEGSEGGIEAGMTEGSAEAAAEGSEGGIGAGMSEGSSEAAAEGSEGRAEAGADSETEVDESENISEAEPVTEADTAVTTALASGTAGQFELAKLLFPEATVLGLIYSAEDKEAAGLAAEYEALASEYGFELETTKIIEAQDIDLAASSMVGSVDGMLCMDDSIVNELVQTICAYADEVEIPVIGISEAQAALGCVAAYDGKTVIWNQEEAEGFGLNLDSLNLENITLYAE